MPKESDLFEKIACKIVEKILATKILCSGTTKKTRDGGIDAIICTEDDLVTVEAKLRLKAKALGLRDIASSVVFYLLRLNDKHYIVTNVHIAKDTKQVIDQINNKALCDICCVDEKTTIGLLNEILNSLDNDEKLLAQKLLESSTDSTSIIGNEQINDICHPMELTNYHNKLFVNICDALHRKQKCVILSGKTGTGKSTVVNAVATAISCEFNTIFIDCQKYNTIESFMYQLSNKQVGIDINELITEYLTISESRTKQTEKSEITSKTNALIQVLRGEQYLDNIAFVAQKYIDNLFECFSIKDICIIIDNYSAASQKLENFISSYIINSSDTVHFITVIDTDVGNSNDTELERLSNLQINLQTLFKCTVNTLSETDTFEFIDSLCKNVTSSCKRGLYSYFGGNLLMTKMALDEMKRNDNYDVSRLRPDSIESIYRNKLIMYISENEILAKAFFVCWVLNSRLPLSLFPLISDQPIQQLLESTGFFDESNGELFICNMCLYRVIADYYTIYSATLHNKLSEFASHFSSNSFRGIAQIRITYFANPDKLSDIAEQEITQFDNKLEYGNIVETRWLLYLVISGKYDDILLAEAEANLLYELIDFKNNYYAIDITRISKNLGDYCKFIDTHIFFSNNSDETKARLSEIRIKYALWSYFVNKRKNDYKSALDVLRGLEIYMNHCPNRILVSKLIRFRAISCKELGNKAEFFNILENGVKTFPNDSYLSATLFANRAASSDKINPEEAYNIIVEEALPAVTKSNEKYLHLWLLNDKLIYAIEASMIRENTEFDFEGEYNIISDWAERLCAKTDKARANNSRGAFLLLNNAPNDVICACFREAFYGICKYEANVIMFYFGVNYLSFLPPCDEDEFSKISGMLLQWCANNAEEIKAKTEVLTVNDKSTNKLIMAIYSFSEVLEKRDRTQYNVLIKINHLAQLFSDRVKMSCFFYIKNRTIILF